MTNGSNAHGISFAQISWLDRLLTGHTNVTTVTRTNDIQFDVDRGRGGPIRIVCLDEYACGIAKVLEVREEFPSVSLIYVGGMWNNYTGDAKQHCVDAEIGLFNTKEMAGALYRTDFWNYVRRD